MKFDEFSKVCMTGGIRHTPSHTNVCKFFIFQLTFSQLILHRPDMLKLCRVTKVKVLFLVLVYVFNFNLFEFSPAILERGLLKSFLQNGCISFFGKILIFSQDLTKSLHMDLF